MSDFKLAIPVILQHEGGLVDNPDDPGGLTKYGISQRSYPGVDIRNLTVEQASLIYERDWWNPHYYGQINDQHVATKVFDMAVNMGTKRAHSIAQRSVNLVQDGIIGPKTIAAINAADPETLLNSMRALQAGYYNNIVIVNPALRQFLAGWLARARY